MTPPTSKTSHHPKAEDPLISMKDIPSTPQHQHHTNRMSILATASRINKAMIPAVRSSVSQGSGSRSSKSSYKVSQMKLPGNAGAKMVQSQAMNVTARPVQNLTTHEDPAALLHMEAMTPGMLQMEIEKQAHQLNRMASLRHSTLVKTKVGGSAGSQMLHHGSGSEHHHHDHSNAGRSSHYRFSLASGARGSYKKPRSRSNGEDGGSHGSSEEELHEHEHLIHFAVPDDVEEEEEEEDHHQEYVKRGTPFYSDGHQVLDAESLEQINAKAARESADAKRRKSSRTRRVAHKEWERLTSVLANGVHSVTKYRSKHTGLNLVHCRVDSPEVYGYFVFRHRCDDDLGLPHIVQHMVFLGSKMFPYPGILDQFAIQCLASGVDAWTQADHSCYTLKTVGKEGFLAILPLYLDHLFHPNLNEAGYLTEVHHLSSHGVDGGVCYREMKSSAHDPVQMAHWGLMQEIFPATSGYYRPYSGSYKELRSQGTLQAVQEFHKKYYTASNASLIVCGEMDPNDLFDNLQPMILSLSVEMKREGSVGVASPNPWAQEAITSIPDMAETTLRYPSETEGQGEVKVAILGAGPDPVLSAALDILFEYLTYSHASPLQEAFLFPTNEQPLASHLSLLKLPLFQPLFILTFQNVPEEKTKEVVPLLRDVLSKEAANTFSPHRMAEVLHHAYEQALALLENHPQTALSAALVQDFIYNFNGDAVRFDRLVNRAYTIQHLTTLETSFWKKLLESLLDTAFASITTLPSNSPELWEAADKEEEDRQRENLATFGRDKLREKALRLKAATRWNARNVPEDVMNMLEPPPLDGFSFLSITHHENPLFCPNSLHYLLLDDLSSNYVYLTCIMDTSELTLEEKKYLPLFATAIVETGYVDDGENHFSPHELIEGLSRDILKYETFFGLQPPVFGKEEGGDGSQERGFTPASFSHLFCIRFQLEMGRVREGFAWMEILLWKTKWESDRLKNVCQRMANELRGLLDQGPVMARMMLSELLYQANSNVRVMSLVRQKAWLERIASELPRAFTRVGKMLEGIRNVVLRPENLMVHLATSLTKLDFYLTDKPEVKDAIPALLKETFDYTGWNWGYPTKRLANEPDSKWMKSRTCMSKCRTEQILRMHASEEGASLLQASPCIQSYGSEDYVALLVAIAYFTQNEGPFHKDIRDPGFASSYSLIVRPEEGLIYFEIKNATDLVSAYTAAFSIVLEHVGRIPKKMTSEEEAQMREIVETLDLQTRTISVSTPNLPERTREQDEDDLWSESLLRSAKSAAIFHLVEQENTPKALAYTSLKNHFCGVSEDYGRSIMARIPSLTMGEVKRVTKAWLGPLFADTSSCAVAAPEKNVPGIIKGMMDNCGKRLTLLPPIHQSELATF